MQAIKDHFCQWQNIDFLPGLGKLHTLSKVNSMEQLRANGEEDAEKILN